MTQAAARQRAAGPRAAAARLHLQLISTGRSSASSPQPIKADLTSATPQFGGIGGLAFALLYSVLGMPFALLADRTSRSRRHRRARSRCGAPSPRLCGTATGFWQLFLFRLGVGIGEAGGVAPSYALIADYFPPSGARGRWRSSRSEFRSACAGGTLIGAYIAAAIDWRAAFFVMGVAGILLAPILLAGRPRRAAASQRGARRRSARSSRSSRASRPSGCSPSPRRSSSLCGYGLAVWTPSVLMRSFGLDLLARPANFLASLVLIGGCAGVFAGGWLADRLGQARPRLVCQAAGDRLADHRADLRRRPARAEPVARLAAAADPQCAQHPVARAGHHRRPASRAAARCGRPPRRASC